MSPVRIQRKRTKGWVMPENTVYVGRPTRWGNPFIVGKWSPMAKKPIDNEGAVGMFKDMLEDREIRMICEYPRDADFDELRGKNLACWCSLDQPCHADVLLKLANQ